MPRAPELLRIVPRGTAPPMKTCAFTLLHSAVLVFGSAACSEGASPVEISINGVEMDTETAAARSSLAETSRPRPCAGLTFSVEARSDDEIFFMRFDAETGEVACLASPPTQGDHAYQVAFSSTCTAVVAELPRASGELLRGTFRASLTAAAGGIVRPVAKTIEGSFAIPLEADPACTR